MTERIQAQSAGAGVAQLQSLLMVVLIAARPLVWDEDPLLPTCTAYTALLLGALALQALIGLRSLRGHGHRWDWRLGGVVLAVLLAWLAVAAARSPLPVAGWGLWASGACQLGLAAYLLQVVPSRVGLALAALASGLMGEALIAVLQWPWVLPAMAHAQRAGGLGSVPDQLQAALAERIANGGLYGTFTQANALAGYLLLAVPPLLVGWWNSPRVARGVLTLALLLALCAFIGTSSKGAVVAAGAATLILWWCRRWKGRSLVTIAALAVVVVALLVPALRQGLHDSAHVRIGYWSAAVQLVREHPWLGCGLRSFGEEAPRVLPLWASYSTQVHNEVLGAAAESGLPGGLLLLALLVVLVVRPLPGRAAPAQGLPHPAWLPWAFGACMLYLCLLGLLDSNTGWWPGSHLVFGGFPLVQMAWWVAMATLMALTCRLLYALPAPSPVACRWALLALVLHSLIDFDLHAGGVTGTAVVLAILGGFGVSPAQAADAGAPGTAPASRPPSHLPRLVMPIGMAVLTAAAIAGLVLVQPRLSRLRSAHAIADTMQAMMQPSLSQGQRTALVQQILADAGMPDLDHLPTREDISRLLLGALGRAMTLASGDPELQTHLLLLLPAGPERLPQSLALAAERPHSAVVESQCAYDYQVIAEGQPAGSPETEASWVAAYRHMQRAVALDPSDLRTHHDLARMLDAAAAALPAQTPMLRQMARAQRELIERERPLVDGSNRD